MREEHKRRERRGESQASHEGACCPSAQPCVKRVVVFDGFGIGALSLVKLMATVHSCLSGKGRRTTEATRNLPESARERPLLRQA
jgi:hypothetical protein